MRRLACGLLLLIVSAGVWPVARAQPAQGWRRLPDDPFHARYPAATIGPAGHIFVLAPKFNQVDYPTILETYDTGTQRWSKVPGPLLDHDALVAVGASLYAVGGWPHSIHTVGSETEIYTPRTRTWTGGTQSHCTHSGGGASPGRDGRIYLLAGNNGFAPGACAEAYSLRTHSWAYLPYLPFAVAWPGVTTGPDGRVYVLGGAYQVRQVEGHVTNRVQVYDPRTGRWTRAASMPTARAGLAAVTGADGRIYAIGGSAEPIGLTDFKPPHPLALGTVEAYDPRTDTWTSLPSLGVPRWGLSAVSAPDGTIYAIGGSASDAIETYQVPRTTSP